MAKQSTKAGTNDTYKAFLNNVDLYALALDNISGEIKRAQYAEAHSQRDGSLIHKLESSFSVDDFEADHFDVVAKFTFAMSATDMDTFLTVTASFNAHFHPKEGSFRVSQAKKFAQAEAKLLFWPYFRQALSDVTGRMYIRPVVIPFAVRQ